MHNPRIMVRDPILIISPRVFPSERRCRIFQQRAAIARCSQPSRDGALLDVTVGRERAGRAAEDVGGAGGRVGYVVGEGEDAITCAGGDVAGDIAPLSLRGDGERRGRGGVAGPGGGDVGLVVVGEGAGVRYWWRKGLDYVPVHSGFASEARNAAR